jgi:hypothetical protein
MQRRHIYRREAEGLHLIPILTSLILTTISLLSSLPLSASLCLSLQEEFDQSRYQLTKQLKELEIGIKMKQVDDSSERPLSVS